MVAEVVVVGAALIVVEAGVVQVETAAGEMLLDLTEEGDRPHPGLTRMPETHIPMTTMTEPTRPGCPQMIGTPMTERGGYLL